MRELVATLGIGLTSAALAQTEGTATRLGSVSDTGDGDGLIEPGESAIISLSIDLEPDVDGDTVLGLGSAIWDTLADAAVSYSGMYRTPAPERSAEYRIDSWCEKWSCSVVRISCPRRMRSPWYAIASAPVVFDVTQISAGSPPT